MSDLISRSMYKSKLIKALDVLDKDYREAILNEDNDLIIAIQNQQSAYMITLRLLDNEPTAYDIGKVVEKLKCDRCESCNFLEVCAGSKYCGKCHEKAIEIVKQGGVADDVCEWRLCDEEANVYDTSCRNPHILIEGTPRENNYEYCPYCGKKIKVVDK